MKNQLSNQELLQLKGGDWTGAGTYTCECTYPTTVVFNVQLNTYMDMINWLNTNCEYGPDGGECNQGPVMEQ